VSDPGTDPVRQIADAVLYEGYLLWPYRRSAMKNRQRWTFGGVYPPAHHEAHPDDRCRMVAQCLLEGEEDGHVEVGVRFLHVVRRQAMAARPDGPEPVDELTVDGERHLSWEEATERETGATVAIAAGGGREPVPIAVPAGRQQEELRDRQGNLAGTIVRSWQALEGALEIGVTRLRPGLHRLEVAVTNSTPWEGGSREDALERTMCSTHAVLRARGGAFVSLTDPPDELRTEAEACRNDGVWPVLVGEPGERHTLLASPIILEDHPRIAPESPGDLFDGGEIDGMLTLNILALTDEEKAEMRESDPKAREILERTEALTEEELMNLHGAIREFQYAARER
jgi:hypothetical protein